MLLNRNNKFEFKKYTYGTSDTQTYVASETHKYTISHAQTNMTL